MMSGNNYDLPGEPSPGSSPESDGRWNMLLSERHGLRLNVGQVSFWRSEIRKPSPDGCGPGTTDQEIEQAIRFAASKMGPRDKFAKKPTVADVVVWVRWFRKEQRQERYGVQPDETGGGVGAFKARMMAASDMAERWHILCQASYAACVELEQWAAHQWGKAFCDARDADRRETAKEAKAAVAVIAGGGMFVKTNGREYDDAF